MSERSELCKKLVKMAAIVFDNLSENEQNDLNLHMDSLPDDSNYLVDDATACVCGATNGTVDFDSKKYCIDCLHYVGEAV